MTPIPPNVWGSTPFKVQETSPDSRYCFNLEQSNTLIHHSHSSKTMLHVEKPWWNVLPQKLPSFLLKGWNEILYRLGYVTVVVEKTPMVAKVSELRNKMLMNTDVIHDAALNGNVKEALDTQVNRLDALGHMGKIRETPEVWAKNVMAAFNITDNRNHTETFIRIHLVPSDVHFYKHLQEEIAKKIPNEWDRPGIEVEISKPNIIPKYTCCIGGGMGPLSDAAIVTKAVGEINKHALDNMRKGDFPVVDPWDDARIVLYSAPSPMRGVKQLGNLPKLFPWWGRVQEFMTRWYRNYPGQTTSYVIASNTAHVQMNTLRTLAKENIFNAVESFAEGISEHNKTNGRVMYLGTTEAYEKKLYPTVFEKNNIQYDSVDRKTQDVIQGIINKTKSMQLDEKDRSDLKSIITQTINKAPPRYLLLGCTELPMALHEEKEFEEDLKKQGIKVIDTEDVIALQIALNVINQSQPGQEVNAMAAWLNRS